MTTLQLKESEITAIRKLGPSIILGWGYRTGEDESHEKYEKRTHSIYLGRLLQDYTDVVFRNIQQVIDYGYNVLFTGDTYGKLQSVENLSEYEQHVLGEVVAEFLTNNDQARVNLKALGKLEEPSIAYSYIVIGIKALCLIADKKYKEAYELAKTESNRLDQLNDDVVARKKKSPSVYPKT